MEKRWVKGLFLIMALFFLVLASCAVPKEVTSQKPSVEEGELQAPQTSVKEPWETKWDNWLEAGKKEGCVTIYATFSSLSRNALMRAFGDKYGIRVEVVSGKGAEISQKILSEKSAGLNIVDLYIGGPTTLVEVIKPHGILAPLEPVLILPEVLDPKAWWKGEPDWIDKEHIVLAFQAYPSNAMALYTEVVKPADIKSYRDLLDPKWKGKIVMNDPTLAGTGSAWVGIVGDKIMGMDFLRDFAKQEPVITRDQRLQVEWIARGKYSIAIKPKEEIVQEFIEAGARLVHHTPMEGTQLASGSGNLAILEKAPHPNATRVFVNWLLSKEGQTVWSKACGSQSGRTDVTTEHVIPSMVRVPGVPYFTSYSEEYMSKKEDFYKIAMEIYGHLIK